MLEPTGYIHSEDARDQYGKCKYDGDDGQPLQYLVLVVGNDARKRIERTTQDIGIDIGHFKGLRIVYDEIIKEFLLLFIQSEEIGAFELHEEEFIGSKRRHEIDQALLDAHELEQVLITTGVIELLLECIPSLVDLLQMFHEILHDLLEDLQYHHIPVVGLPVLKAVKELLDGRVLE